MIKITNISTLELLMNSKNVCYNQLRINTPIEKVWRTLPNIGKVTKMMSKFCSTFSNWLSTFIVMSRTVRAICVWVKLVTHDFSLVQFSLVQWGVLSSFVDLQYLILLLVFFFFFSITVYHTFINLNVFIISSTSTVHLYPPLEKS